MQQKTVLPLNARFLGAFAALSFLCLGAHELVHHLVARLTCGAWGTMTFWQFFLAPGCALKRTWLLATAAGPVLTHGLMWTGLVLILRGKALAGVALIFANLPLARFVTVLMKGGDEMVVGRALVGEGSWPGLLAMTVMLILPPLVIAFRALENRHRALVLTGFLVLPLLWDMLVKRVVLSPLLEVATSEFKGVPLLVMGAYALAALLLLLLWPRRVAMVAHATNRTAADGYEPARP
jgi:hypothetical protein